MSPVHAFMPYRFPLRTLFAAAASCIAIAAFAAEPANAADAQARYQRERAACLSGQTSQDRETCLKEAGAALQQARRGAPVESPSDLERNRLVRCDVQPLADRPDCVRRMKGEGVTSGSVEAGGIYRELTTREVPQPAN